jgi:hypothetical protein
MKICSFIISLYRQRHIVAYLNGLQAKVNALRGLQSTGEAELDASAGRAGATIERGV